MGSPEKSSRPMKPTWAVVRMARGEVSTTWCSWLGPEVRQRKQQGSRNKRRTGRYAGRVRLAVAPDRSAQSLGGFIERSVTPGSTIITDDWSGYVKLGERGYYHTAVAERGDVQIAETFLPIIHLVFSNLKSWLRGIHRGVSPQHLQAYLNEFTFRFNRRFYMVLRISCSGAISQRPCSGVPKTGRQSLRPTQIGENPVSRWNHRDRPRPQCGSRRSGRT